MGTGKKSLFLIETIKTELVKIVCEKKGNEMTLKEILKSKGMSEEDIATVIDEMKQNKIFTSSEENLDVRYTKLKTDHDALVTKDAESQKLIAELQTATKGQEKVQAEIAKYQAEIAKQQEELQQTKIDSAVKIALLGAGAKASDIDYLIFKMSADPDWKPSLDEDGNVKGIDDKLKGMKTQFPAQFESSATKKIEEKKLEKSDDGQKVTKEDFNKMGYQAKLKIFNENPELYEQLKGEK